jgi:hypothetical protein
MKLQQFDLYHERKFGSFNITIHLLGAELLNLLVYFTEDSDEKDMAMLVRNIYSATEKPFSC